METTSKKPSMTWVKGMKSPNPAGRRLHKNKSAVIQSAHINFIKNRYTEQHLNKLLDGGNKRDDLMFYALSMPYVFVKPMPVKDSLERCTPEELDDIYQKVMMNNRAVNS